MDDRPFDLCIYHDPCLDGFTAAWVIQRRWPGIRLHPGVYGQEPPDVTGLHVLIVDFSYKQPVLVEMGKVAASITILDHHESAERELLPWAVSNITHLHNPLTVPAKAAEFKVSHAAVQHPLLALPIQAYFDMHRSGARLAWDYCWPDKVRPPSLVEHVEDRDLWRFAIPDTKQVIAALDSYDKTFPNWDHFAAQLETAQGQTIIRSQGQAILRVQERQLRQVIKESRRTMVIGGHTVPVANVPYYMASEASDILGQGTPFSATYFDSPDGRKFSLRVRDGDMNVSKIAEGYGGGGHAKASGFLRPLGWEGDLGGEDNDRGDVRRALNLLADYMTASGDVDPDHAAILAHARSAVGATVSENLSPQAMDANMRLSQGIAGLAAKP